MDIVDFNVMLHNSIKKSRKAGSTTQAKVIETNDSFTPRDDNRDEDGFLSMGAIKEILREIEDIMVGDRVIDDMLEKVVRQGEENVNSKRNYTKNSAKRGLP